MPPHKNALVVVAKQPSPGITKTRLCPPLKPDEASSLYECFLLDTLDQMRKVEDVQRIVAYLPREAHSYFQHIAPDFELSLQKGHDLGSRLDNAVNKCLSEGYENTVIMDSDSPTLPVPYLSHAFDALSDGADVVLGPCDDGGYYLIGVKKAAPRLLREVKMSTPNVTADTIAIAQEEGLDVFELPTWYDVDDGLSLSRLMEELDQLEATKAIHSRQYLEQESIRRLIREGG
jgi:uncharacterized protein